MAYIFFPQGKKNNFRMNMTRQQEGHIVVRPQSLGWSGPYKSGWLRGSQEAMATNAASPRGGQRTEQGPGSVNRDTPTSINLEGVPGLSVVGGSSILNPIKKGF